MYQNNSIKDTFYDGSMTLSIILSITTLIWCCCVNIEPVFFACSIAITSVVYLLQRLSKKRKVFGLPSALLFFNLCILTVQPMNNEPFNNSTLYAILWVAILLISVAHLWKMRNKTKRVIRNQTEKKEKILLACNASVNIALSICTLILLVFVDISPSNLLPIILGINYIPTMITTW